MDQRLRDILEAFDREVPIGEALTPPSEWYTSRELLDFELRSVFRNNWVAVGLAERVSKPGHYVSGNLLGEPYVIVRSQDGELHAFDNVCRHHATTLVKGEGCIDNFQCPYHGWVYDLEGKLLGAPRMGSVPSFNKEAMGLKKRHAALWGPLLFLYLGENPSDLNEQLAPLKAFCRSDLFDGLTWSGGESHPVESNWKVYVDNYLDGGYHVPILHKGLTADLNMKSYETTLFERSSVQRVGGDKENERVGQGADYIWIYPNLMINRYGPVLDVNIVIPQDVDKTSVRFDYWFEDTEGAYAQRFMMESRAKSREVQDEDAMICASVQEGLRSSAYDRGCYAPSIEHGEHHFHLLLAQDYEEGIKGA